MNTQTAPRELEPLEFDVSEYISLVGEPRLPDPPDIGELFAYENDKDAKPEKVSRTIELFSETQIASMAASVAGAANEEIERIKKIINTFTINGNLRKFSTLPEDFHATLDVIIQEQPNFEEVIEMNVRPSLSILAAGGIARPAPLLLLGSPGVGKTFFAQQMAQLLKIPDVIIDMASAQTNAAINGSASFWSNTKPGYVFSALLYGCTGTDPVINPIIFLDEIDKVSEHRGYDPLSGLYSLLEIQSAKRFSDESVPGLQMNASYIRWILAANNLDAIPAPIKSRCHIFEIPELTTAQKIEVFARVFSQVVASCELEGFCTSISKQLIESNLHKGMREFKTLATVAIGRALCAGRLEVTTADFSDPSSNQKPKMGFIDK